jgi:hypothetical protein
MHAGGLENHVNKDQASPIQVMVMVWLCSWQLTPGVKGLISP